MPNEFYEWLDQCPVEWRRMGDNKDFADYRFIKPDPEEEEK